MSKTPLLKTLKLPKLLDRWSNLSLENIYELADQGYFGLYTKPHRKRKTSYDIQKHIQSLIQTEPENEYYKELMECFKNFVSNNMALIENKTGYERLPTSAEVKIFPSCETSSIQFLNQYKIIEFYEVNNVFGIVKLNGCFVCNSYLLRATSLTGKYPEDYKGNLPKEDLFVFINEIEHFESDEILRNILYTPMEKKALDIPVAETTKNKFLNKKEQHSSDSLLQDRRGDNHAQKRVLTLKYAIAVLLDNPNLTSGNTIAHSIEGLIKKKEQSINLLGRDKMTRLINKGIKLEIVDSFFNYKTEENIHNLILSITFSLKSQHFGNINNFIDLVATKISQLIDISIQEIINRLHSCLNLV